MSIIKNNNSPHCAVHGVDVQPTLCCTWCGCIAHTVLYMVWMYSLHCAVHGVDVQPILLHMVWMYSTVWAVHPHHHPLIAKLSSGHNVVMADCLSYRYSAALQEMISWMMTVPASDRPFISQVLQRVKTLHNSTARGVL